ncbi:uncharacterized protein LOC144564134 [Carex rostrata]
MTNRIAKELCGRKLDQFATRDAEGTRGGILIAWNTRKFLMESTSIRTYSLSMLFKNIEDSSTFLYTGVYGPSTRANRSAFFEELKSIKPTNNTPWILSGDFNVTMRQEERSNPNSDWRGTLTFARLASDLDLLNITLQGRRFTWSNERDNPSMAQLDRFLISIDWNNKFPNSKQKSLPNTSSDHCPILFTAQTQFQKTNFFRFENCWLKFKQLDEIVAQQWEAKGDANTPEQLQVKLQALQKAIKIWAAERVGSIKSQINVCREFLGWMDKAKETRNATPLEKFVTCQIKRRYTQLATLEEDIWRQRAKLRWELEGDKNTRYFHAFASNSKRNNTIMQIEWHGQQFSDQRAKAEAFFQFYKGLMGKTSHPMPHICWENLYSRDQHDLQALQDPITLQEVQQVIQAWPRNKSPGPDGFTELRQIQILKIVLTAFESISGLAVNLNKSELLTTGIPQETGQELALAMGCKLGQFPLTYLGLPLSNKKLPKTAYLPLIQRFSARLAGWAATNLSIAGRLTLLNAVLSALPTYFMSCLKLPVWVIKDIDKIRRHFLWHGVTQQKKKLNLANWKMICKPKQLGGLGIMELFVFNDAMLAKWYWQWANPERRLWKTIFNQTNQTLCPVPKSHFFNITLKNVYSFMDVSMLRIVGRGDTILFWSHNWGAGVLKGEFQILYTYAIDQNLSVAQVLNVRHIRELFKEVPSQEAAEQLTQLYEKLSQQPILLNNEPDEARWKWTPEAQFSVKSYYQAFKHAPTRISEASKVWKIKAPPRMQVFSWLMVLNKVLTIDNLNKRGWSIVNRCTMCKLQLESVRHLFEECIVTKEIYQQLSLIMGMNMPTQQARKALLGNELNKKEKSLLLIAQFVIWRERCTRTFTDKSNEVQILVHQAQDQWMITMKMDRQALT